jgi:hypothetical protein
MKQKQTTLPVDQAQAQLVQLLAGYGAIVTSQQSGFLAGTVTTHKRPSIILGVILLCIFIIPGIIYFVVAGKDKTEPFTITIAADGTITENGTGGGLSAARRAVDRLPSI